MSKEAGDDKGLARASVPFAETPVVPERKPGFRGAEALNRIFGWLRRVSGGSSRVGGATVLTPEGSGTCAGRWVDHI